MGGYLINKFFPPFRRRGGLAGLTPIWGAILSIHFFHLFKIISQVCCIIKRRGCVQNKDAESPHYYPDGLLTGGGEAHDDLVKSEKPPPLAEGDSNGETKSYVA